MTDKTRTMRLLTNIATSQEQRSRNIAKATLLREIANEFMVRAEKLDTDAAYLARQITDWEKMLHDEEAKA